MQIIGEKKILNVLISSTLNAAMAQLIEQLLVVQKNWVQIPYIPLLFSMQKRSLEIIEVINKILLDLPWPSGNSYCFYMEGWGSNPTPSLFFHAGKKFIKNSGYEQNFICSFVAKWLEQLLIKWKVGVQILLSPSLFSMQERGLILIELKRII